MGYGTIDDENGQVVVNDSTLQGGIVSEQTFFGMIHLSLTLYRSLCTILVLSLAACLVDGLARRLVVSKSWLSDQSGVSLEQACKRTEVSRAISSISPNVQECDTSDTPLH